MNFEASVPPTQPLDAPAATLVFGEFSLDRGNASLLRGTTPVSLTPRAFSVLEYLAQHAGRLVTKDEFMDRIWPGVFVGDAALKVCVREIRRALADDPQQPEYVETAHRRGYRFIAPVKIVDQRDRRRAAGRGDAPSRGAPLALPIGRCRRRTTRRAAM